MLRSRPAATGPPSQAGTWAGTTWSSAIALSYFFLSSPLALEPDFGESLRRAVWCTTIACVITLPRLRMPVVPWAAIPFLTFGLASSAWSTNRNDTIHFVGLYVVLTILGVVVASNVGARVLAHGAMGGAVIVIATSVYAYWQKLPGADVLPGSSGFLAGVGTNRNILTYTMILAFPFAASFVPPKRWLRVGWAAAIVVIVGGIALAESATGIVAVCVISGVALILGSQDHLRTTGRTTGRRHWTIVTTLLVSLPTLALVWYEASHRDAQRDLSLTGRVRIWESVWASSRTQTRIIGEGWGSVWQHPWRPASPNGEFDNVVRDLGSYVAHGHNSVMDLVPEVGLVGVGLFALIYVVTLLMAITDRRSPDATYREAGRVKILGVLALVLAGVTEPISTIPLGFFVAILVLAQDPSEPPPPAAEATAPS